MKIYDEILDTLLRFGFWLLISLMSSYIIATLMTIWMLHAMGGVMLLWYKTVVFGLTFATCMAIANGIAHLMDKNPVKEMRKLINDMFEEEDDD